MSSATTSSRLAHRGASRRSRFNRSRPAVRRRGGRRVGWRHRWRAALCRLVWAPPRASRGRPVGWRPSPGSALSWAAAGACRSAGWTTSARAARSTPRRAVDAAVAQQETL